MPYPESTVICKDPVLYVFQQYTGTSFVYSILDMPCFYVRINCSAFFLL